MHILWIRNDCTEGCLWIIWCFMYPEQFPNGIERHTRVNSDKLCSMQVTSWIQYCNAPVDEKSLAAFQKASGCRMWSQIPTSSPQLKRLLLCLLVLFTRLMSVILRSSLNFSPTNSLQFPQRPRVWLASYLRIFGFHNRFWKNKSLPCDVQKVLSRETWACNTHITCSGLFWSSALRDTQRLTQIWPSLTPTKY